jgi:hypothetical protein
MRPASVALRQQTTDDRFFGRPARVRLPAAVTSGLVVLALGSFARLRNYELSWFGHDQSYFLEEARRVAAGDFGVTGPMAASVNVIGPLYSYLLGGLLWLGGDAGFLALCNALLEVVAVGVVFLCARRLSGLTGAIVAASTYACVPILVLSTRIIWNPSWLPLLVVTGWWLVVRYIQKPTLGRLIGVALAVGLAPTLHATGVLHSLGWIFVLVMTRPPLAWLGMAAVVGAIPLLPVLSYTLMGRVQAASARTFLPIAGVNSLSSTVDGIRELVAAFPLALAEATWSGSLATHAFHAALLMAAVGLARGLVGPSPLRHVWLGIASTFVWHVAAASLHSGYLSWYYFMALIGPMCLGLAHGISALKWRPARRGAAVAFTSAAIIHLAFVAQFDRRTIEAGYIRVDGRGLQVFNVGRQWRQANAVPHSIPLSGHRWLADALRTVVPDGSTAMLVSHGARAELWRTTGAEFMPTFEPEPSKWPWQFVIMGPVARPVAPRAFVLANRICVFDQVGDPTWRVSEDRMPADWDSPGFDDRMWSHMELPRRLANRSQSGPSYTQSVWKSPRVRLRGEFELNDIAPAQFLYAISIHSSTPHSISAISVNGIAVPVRRNRVLSSDVFRNEEWLFDLAPMLRAGTNVVTVQVEGQSPVFDLDIFRVPCVDTDWYH